MSATPERPLFISLKTEYYRAFQNGTKSTEYRPEGPGWNRKTCRIGRRVTLSKGYGKRERMEGTVISYSSTMNTHEIAGWAACYGQRKGPVACILIAINALDAVP